jgi:hypothetical protein
MTGASDDAKCFAGQYLGDGKIATLPSRKFEEFLAPVEHNTE